jgi:hypothetical protein
MNEFFAGEYEAIPENMRPGMMDYVEKGKRPGDFLTAVITNNLKDAVCRADSTNLPLIKLYVLWFHNVAPEPCQGSAEKMKAWMARGRE